MRFGILEFFKLIMEWGVPSVSRNTEPTSEMGFPALSSSGPNIVKFAHLFFFGRVGS